MLALFAVAAGAVAGMALSPVRRERAGISGSIWLLGVAMTAVMPRLADISGPAVFLVSQAALCAFLIHNRRHTGVLVIALGIALNALPILVNGGMPVSVSASEVAGVDAPTAAAPTHHLPMGRGTRLNFLGDGIAFAPTGQVLSLGDLVMLAGFAITSASAVRTVRGKGPSPLKAAGSPSSDGGSARILGRTWD